MSDSISLTTLTKSLLKLDNSLSSCMRCGSCQAVCPVFAQTTREADVARGKIVLLQNLAHEIIRDPKAVEERLHRCLLCGACQSNCASGVKILEIFMEGRSILTQYQKLSTLKKFIFRTLLPRPKLFAMALRTGSVFQGLILRKQKNKQNTSTAPLLTPLLGPRQIPALAKMQLHKKYGDLQEQGSHKINVIFYPGCMTDKIYPQIGDAVLKILRHHNVGVTMPSDFSCCGMPALASGDTEGFKKLLNNNLDVFNRIDPDNSIDYIISACPSCTETIHNWWLHYGQSLDEQSKQKLQNMSAKTMDIHKFLHDVLASETLKPTEQNKQNETSKQTKLTYHDSCHLKKSLNVSKEPRELLKQNQAYNLSEMPEADNCCGCGGSFTLTQAKLSLEIGTRKRNNIIASKAECVATGCPACMMQLSDMLARNNDNVSVKHSIEIIAEGLINA